MIVKKKGFTLIELLTVIAILAIILLISTPIILNVLEKSKKNNFRNQALLYVDGLKQNALLDSMSDNQNIVLPEVGKSLSINVDDITMDSDTNVTGNIVVTNNNGNYNYVLYITNGEYIICNKEYNKVTTDDIKKGNTCGDSLLYPTISNKYQTQTYNYKYNITKELILNGVTATDTRDGDITNKITYTGSVDTSRLGEYEIIYSVENSLGNISTTKRTIQVRDTESPTITNTVLKEEIDKGSTYNKYLEGITVEDNYDTGLEATYICKNGILQTVECSTIGSKAGVYYIIYDATDSSGNKYSETSNIEVKREIVVHDINAPEIKLKGESVVRIEVGSTFTEPGYTAIDDEDGDVTANVETSSNLNTNIVGTYTIQYIVVDSAGNRGVQTRTIQVVDTTKPEITSVTGNPTNWVTSATITVEATDKYKLHETPYSFDNGITWQATKTKTFTTNGEVNIKVRDESGNISEVSTVNITKVDTTEPEATITLMAGNVINTGLLNSIVIQGGRVGDVRSIELNLSTSSKYLVAFDYKTSSGTNQFDVDFYPDTLPQINPIATTSLQHIDWVTSSSNPDIENCTLRFFDDRRSTEEADITITNPTLYELKNYDSVTNSNIVLISIEGVTDRGVGLADAPYSFDNGATWQINNTKTFTSNGTINIKVRDKLGNIVSKSINISKID